MNLVLCNGKRFKAFEKLILKNKVALSRVLQANPVRTNEIQPPFHSNIILRYTHFEILKPHFFDSFYCKLKPIFKISNIYVCVYIIYKLPWMCMYIIYIYTKNLCSVFSRNPSRNGDDWMIPICERES